MSAANARFPIAAFAEVSAGLALRASVRDERWCLVRWMQQPGRENPNDPAAPKDYFCGPLSPMTEQFTQYIGGLGFPGGQVGAVATWDSEAEAAAFSDDRRVSIDVPTPMHELHFSVEVYSHWDDSLTVLYDGGELRAALTIRALFIGWAMDRCGSNYWKCTMRCRPGAATRMRQLAPGESAALGTIPELRP